MANVKFVPPRVPLVDLRTGQITREWYLLLQSLFDGADGPGAIPVPDDDMQTAIFVPEDQRIDQVVQEIAPRPEQPQNGELQALAASQAIMVPAPDYRRHMEELALLLNPSAPADVRAKLDELELMLSAPPPIQRNDIALAFGLYTPAFTAVANVGSSTPYACAYLRVGNVVMVAGKLDMAAAAAPAVTQLGISLPIASNFTADSNCGGSAAPNSAVASYPGAINADAANDRAQLNIYSPNTANLGMFFTFGYYIYL